ncbi:hypothetical protein BST61_g1843 [Cercospora zeina]
MTFSAHPACAKIPVAHHPSVEELEDDLGISSTVIPLVNQEKNPSQQGIYTSLPIKADSQIRVLEIQPGPLNSPIICNLIVQDIDLTTRRRPPPTIHRDMIGNMFSSKGVIDYFRRNNNKDEMIRDLRTWMPRAYRERHDEKLVAAHAADSALPAFNALSYTWGNWDDPMSITIICINQKDEEEKAWQVRAMGNIYSLAWDVLIWFGDLDDEDLEPLKASGHEGRRQIAERLLKVMENAQATWWTRTWCIQESMMARQDPLAVFADCSMRWTEMSRIEKRVKDDREFRELTWSVKKHFSKTDNAPSEKDAENDDPVELVGAPCFSFQRIKYMSTGVRTLASMGWAYSQTEATDPRDKVYSMLALIEPADSALIEIDYKKPVSWVYAEATHASIMASGNIHILGLVKGDKSELELQSWCVDFGYAGKAIDQSWVTTGDFSQYLFTPVEVSSKKGVAVDAGGAREDSTVLPWTNRLQCTTAKASLSVRRRLLVLRGLEFDVVVKTIHQRTRKFYWDNMKTGAKDLLKAPLGLFSNEPIMLTKNEQAVFQSVLDLMDGAANPYEKLIRNIGHPASTSNLHEDCESSMTDDEAEEKVSMLSFRLFDVWSRRFLRGHVSGLTKVAWRQHGLWKLYFRHLCHGDTFFITSNGFIGLGHSECQAGDVIALPYGSRHPVLLRPDTGKDRYSFSGFCCVNGIMNDELRKVMSDLVLREKEFVLR